MLFQEARRISYVFFEDFLIDSSRIEMTLFSPSPHGDHLVFLNGSCAENDVGISEYLGEDYVIPSDPERPFDHIITHWVWGLIVRHVAIDQFSFVQSLSLHHPLPHD